MQYTILIYETEQGFAARKDPSLMSDYWAGTMSYVKAIRESGKFVAGAGLELPETATTLMYKEDKSLIQDGPVTVAKEQLGGLFIINAVNIDEALMWARKFPQRPGIKIEVRPNLAQER